MSSCLSVYCSLPQKTLGQFCWSFAHIFLYTQECHKLINVYKRPLRSASRDFRILFYSYGAEYCLYYATSGLIDSIHFNKKLSYCNKIISNYLLSLFCLQLFFSELSPRREAQARQLVNNTNGCFFNTRRNVLASYVTQKPGCFTRTTVKRINIFLDKRLSFI